MPKIFKALNTHKGVYNVSEIEWAESKFTGEELNKRVAILNRISQKFEELITQGVVKYEEIFSPGNDTIHPNGYTIEYPGNEEDILTLLNITDEVIDLWQECANDPDVQFGIFTFYNSPGRENGTPVPLIRSDGSYQYVESPPR